MLASFVLKSLEKNAMGFLVTMFVSVVLAVVGLISNGVEAKTVTRNGAVYSCDYNCSNSQLVQNNACRPGSLPPSFRSPQENTLPPQIIPASPIVEAGNDLRNAVGGLFGMVVCICAAVAGGFAGYRQEKAKDELIAETETAKEKAFVESHSAKMAAAKAAAAAK